MYVLLINDYKNDMLISKYLPNTDYAGEILKVNKINLSFPPILSIVMCGVGYLTFFERE